MYGLNAPLQIHADSTTDVPGAGSEITIPDRMDGNPAKYVLLTARIGTVAWKPINAGETPAITTMARLMVEESLVVNVAGSAAIRAIEVDSSAEITVTPLENQ